jgi:O-antigen ligase
MVFKIKASKQRGEIMFGPVLNIWKESDWQEKLLYIYTILIPFIDYYARIILNKKILYADFVFIFLFIAWMAKYLSGKIKLKLTHLKFSLVLLPALFAVSFLNSSGIFSSIAELLGLIYLIVLFILASDILDSQGKIRFALYLYFFVSAILSVIGLGFFSLAMATGDLRTTSFLGYGTMESIAHHFPRIDLTFESANMALAYLHIALVFGIILFMTEKRKRLKAVIVLSLLIIMATAFFSGSRRFTGLLLSLFLILSWYGRGRVISALKYLLFLGFSIFLTVSIITSIWVVFPLKVTKDVSSKNIVISANYGYSIHSLLPAVSLNMFKKHPFVGVGLGTYNRNFRDYVDWEWLKTSFGFEAYPGYVELVKEKKLNFDPHSVFLGTLAETGLLGFCALIYFLATYAVTLAGRFRRSSHLTFDNIISGCVGACFIGFIFNALTLDILSMRHFWFMLAIGVCGLKKNNKSYECLKKNG